jgi:hypothetical protein
MNPASVTEQPLWRTGLDREAGDFNMSLQPIRRALSSRQLPIVATLLATALASPALWAGLELDDYRHRETLLGSSTSLIELFAFQSGNGPQPIELIDVGAVPWWTHPRLRIVFFRPIAALTHWLDYRVWPNLPALMHAQSLLWFAACVAVAARAYRRFQGPTWVAGLAALMFAVDDAHANPAGWIANRNATRCFPSCLA